MIARPSLAVIALGAAGALALYLVEPSLPGSIYKPAALGAGAALLATSVLLRDLPRAPRHGLAFATGSLGFFVGSAAAGMIALHRWPLGFAAAWLPAFLLFLAGYGRERLALELMRLENEIDDQSKRAGVIDRAAEIRDKMLANARAIDKDATGSPLNPGDPRGVYAYAAQVVAYGHALEGRFDEAVKSLGAVPIPWMPAPMRLLMLSNLAFWQVCSGDLRGAKNTVDTAPEKDALPETRVNLRASRALVHVLLDDPDAALAIVGKSDGDEREPERIRPRYTIVRAHAYAAKKENERARAELESILDSPLGADELRRMLPARGPANKLIEEVMREGPAGKSPKIDPAPRAEAPT